MTQIFYKKKTNPPNKKQTIKNQKGFSLPELIIVLLIIAILVVLALPQITASRRLLRFSAMQRQVATALNETRQHAMSQRNAVTFRYDDASKRIIIYGGSFGVFGDAKNQKTDFATSGLVPGEIVYGRPSGASAAALGDSSNMTELSAGFVDITFQSDGSVVDAGNNPVNKALFFYDVKSKKDTAFAVSVLGAGGRTKIWRYSKGVDAYVE
jgi:prepilin-type N-terminal cleavage/methylation domain-containing protein